MKRGFTLIELLIVIGMVALLAAMVLPALTKARSWSGPVCSANVHNLGLGWAMFRKDHDGNWTREECGPDDLRPDIVADIVGLGYLRGTDVLLCPALDTPFRRQPELIHERSERASGATGPILPTGEVIESSYFADEGRVAREPLAQRAILADGIEMVTLSGLGPANHADDAGRAEGANVLFADMAGEWVAVYRKEHPWTLSTPGTGTGVWPDQVNSYGYAAGADPYPRPTAGTWKRYGYIQNPRLLVTDPDDKWPSSGTGTGEDDLENGEAEYAPVYGGEAWRSLSHDVDDIYYVDATGEHYGEAARWAFIAYARGARCVSAESKSDRDCSLGGGHIRSWRMADALGRHSSAYSGSCIWGWPEELVP